MPITLGPARTDTWNIGADYVDGMGQSDLPEEDIQINPKGIKFAPLAEKPVPLLGEEERPPSSVSMRSELDPIIQEDILKGGVRPERPTFWGAALRTSSEIVSHHANVIRSAHGGFTPTEGYDAMDDIRGTKYENYDTAFVGSVSREDTMHRVQKIEQELADRKRVMDDGVLWGVVGMGASSLVSPLSFVPFGGISTSILRSAAKTSLLTAAAVAGQEYELHKSQDTRTLEESAYAVGGAAAFGGVFGGILGGAAKFFKKTPVAGVPGNVGIVESPAFGSAMGDIMAGKIPYNQADIGAAVAGAFEGASGGAARVLEEGTGEIVGGKFLKKTGMASWSPVTRLQTSMFKTARNTVRHMADAGLKLKDNLKDIVTSKGGTIETRVKLARGPLYEAVAKLDQLYAAYYLGHTAGAVGRSAARAGSAMRQTMGRLGNKLGLKQFREEVSRAMANGDKHHIPEVQEAARYFREKVFNPLKEKAIRLGLLPEDVKALFAKSYITRMFNTEKILADQRAFKELLVREFRKSRPEEVIDKAELYNEAEEITNSILGLEGRNAALDFATGATRGPLKERLLAIPDNVLDPYLERDINKIADYYTRTMASDIELTAKFGSANMEKQLGKDGKGGELLDEYNRLDDAAKTPKEKARIFKEYEAARDDLLAMRDRIRGTYAIPKDPRSRLRRAGRIARHWNYVRMLGGMTLSAIPDIARPVMAHGLLRSFGQGYARLITNFGTFRMAAAEVKKLGTALDVVLDNNRSAQINEIFDKFQQGTKFERGVEWTSNKMAMASLMAPWNATLKQISGMIYMDRALRAMEKATKGKARVKGGFFRKSDTDFLRQAGIDDQMAKEIWQLFENGGGDRVNGLYLPNTEVWGQGLAPAAKRRAMDLRDAFAAAMIRDVDNVIITPGLERPLYMDTDLGKFVGQFKAFAMSATQRMLISGLQTPDLAMINGLALSTALGMASSWVKGKISGHSTDHWGPVKWVVEGIDRSGITGVFSEANNILEKMHPMLGLSALTGETASRYSSRGRFGALAGPTVGLIDDIMGVSSNLGVEGWSASDTHRVRGLIPYNNLFYLRGQFDKMEEEFNRFWGFPQYKPRKPPARTR